MSRSGASGWTSGKQAPPIVKSQPAEMNSASSAALPRPPSGWTKSSSPRGGSPRSAKTFSIPAARDPVERLREALPGLADAAQVRHRLQADLRLERLGDLDRALAGGAAGAVGDRGKVKLQVGEGAGGGEELLGRLGRLRREELDREGRLGRGDDLVDAHPGRVGQGDPDASARKRRSRPRISAAERKRRPPPRACPRGPGSRPGCPRGACPWSPGRTSSRRPG